ncbi:MAG: hypothetical protein P8Z30_09190, partial [Acidobacteriota bacterium]
MASRFWKALPRKLTHLAFELLRIAFPLSTTFERDRVRYWQALPLRRMARMVLGVFCTLSGLG